MVLYKSLYYNILDYRSYHSYNFYVSPIYCITTHVVWCHRVHVVTLFRRTRRVHRIFNLILFFISSIYWLIYHRYLNTNKVYTENELWNTKHRDPFVLFLYNMVCKIFLNDLSLTSVKKIDNYFCSHLIFGWEDYEQSWRSTSPSFILKVGFL